MSRSRLSFEEAMLIWEARDVYRVHATLRGLVLLFFALELLMYATVGVWYIGLVVVGLQWAALRVLRWLVLVGLPWCLAQARLHLLRWWQAWRAQP